MSDDTTDNDDNVDTSETSMDSTSCVEGSDVYTPYSASAIATGTVAQYPWRGSSSTYPDGVEDFRGYASMPVTVECSTDKARRSYVDVTAGCLTAVQLGSYTRGQIGSDLYRALALGRTSSQTAPVKWTDQSAEYRFYYSGQTNSINNPGFKVFLRYRSEDDLYVASWRMDGVVQIQKKQCGVYTALAVLKTYGRPSTTTWHKIKFTAVGDRLELYLDDVHVLGATSSTFAWGTAGMRIDSLKGAYIDDWHVSQP
ncbi:MAG TPA: hypothetical protein VFQ53_24760 [Kofleriaceae bacterium]|nr:hypothetical protein [Kofleriaceae bacterium]